MQKLRINLRLLVILTVLAITSLAPVPALAQGAMGVRVQGNVLNSGTPLNGTFAMVFRIYDNETAGSLLWTESHGSVSFTNGVYSVTLGETTPLTGIFVGANDERWLSIQVGSDPEFSPRQRMIAAPYAHYAVDAGNATTLGNQSLSYFSSQAAAVQNDAETLSMLRGVINADATIAAGAGFTCTSGGTGIYNISINPAQYFGSMPAVTALPTSPDYALVVTSSFTSAITITAVRRSNGVAENAKFHFIAAGPRLSSNPNADVDGDGITVGGGDCDDNDGAVFPGATEICDGKDNDCDGIVDDNVTGGTTYYFDADGDGFGVPGNSITACSQPTSYVTNSTDCDDSDASVYPGAAEHCDGKDNDCDGVNDDNAIGGMTYHADNDSDGFGDPGSTIEACTQPPGYVMDSNDCDDNDATVFPGATETCNGKDNDCDGIVDDNPSSGGTTYYFDADGDGYGVAGVTTTACTQPVGYAANSGDCDDSNPSINPGASEVCGDGIDNDCNGFDQSC